MVGLSLFLGDESDQKRVFGYNIDSCLGTEKFGSKVQKDFVDATAEGRRKTSYFVINGKQLGWAQLFNAFR